MDKPVLKVVIGIIQNQDMIAVAKQVNDKQQAVQVNADGQKDFLLGLWHMPGGKVNDNEPLEAAMVREAKEEVGVDVQIIKLLGEHQEEREKAILHLHWFLCETEAKTLTPGDDADDAQFVKREEVPNYCATMVVSQWPQSVREFFGMRD